METTFINLQRYECSTAITLVIKSRESEKSASNFPTVASSRVIAKTRLDGPRQFNQNVSLGFALSFLPLPLLNVTQNYNRFINDTQNDYLFDLEYLSPTHNPSN